MDWACRGCGTILLIGVRPCAHCRSGDIATDHREVEEIMSKISKTRGATRFTPDPQTYDAFTLEPANKPEPEVAEDETVEPERPEYPTLTVAQLKAELDQRADAYRQVGDFGSADAISYTTTDKKDDLIKTLEFDDGARAARDQ